MRLAVLFLLAVAPLGLAEETWRDRVQPALPGNFPPVRPFNAEFRFGWSNLLEAARAQARLRYDGDHVVVDVRGGTRGLARALWTLDAKHHAVSRLPDYMPDWFLQSETYTDKTIFNEIAARPDGLWFKRSVPSEPSNRPRWKRLKVEPVRDIVSAMLFLRTQPLQDGDRIGLIGFPGDSPFLCEVLVEKREPVKLAGRSRPAIKMSFRLQRIDTSRGNQLVAHTKFRTGTVWVSDDINRVPLRAEVRIFVGYVYGELAAITYLQ